MKPITLTIYLLALAGGALAQATTVISGRVHTLKNKPVAGASVGIKDGYDGATTDSLGQYRFTTTDTGRQVMLISSMGFKTLELPLLLDGKALVQDVQLREDANELTAVIITAGSFEASDEKKVTVLKPLDIVTTASANADVSAAMKTLPGTQQIGESAELFVRGGEGYETRQFIDGTMVPNPFFSQAPNIASRGRFSPFLFKGTVFSTGGYSALYGQALSSALILESIDLPERSSASLSVSPIFGGAQYQHLAKDKKSSWGASVNYANLGAYFVLIKQRPDYFRAPNGAGGDINFRIKTSATGMLKFYATYAHNSLGLRNPDIDNPAYKNAFALTNGNAYSNLSYRERLTNRLKLQAGMSYSRNTDDISQQLQNENNEPVGGALPPVLAAKNFAVVNVNHTWQARGVLEYKLRGLSNLKAGAEYWYSRDVSTFQQAFTGTITDHFVAAFAEADVYLTSRLAGRAGVRAEHSQLLNRANLMPRASLAYKLRKGEQLSADYGIYYQKPQNQYLWQAASLGYLRADHYILTYQKLSGNRVFRTQLFHKGYQRLTRTTPDTSNTGQGYARGVEFFWRDKTTFKNFDYWVTYSYLDTKRDYLNFPYSMQPSFAANHTANLVVKRFFTKLKTQFNVNYQFATGRPYYDLAYSPSNQKWDIRDQGKTIAYNNLSLSLNYITNIGKAFGVVVFSMNNVLNSKQVFGYSYSADGTHKVAVVPPANRFIFLGLFLSWGIDRTQDAINNNL